VRRKDKNNIQILKGEEMFKTIRNTVKPLVLALCAGLATGAIVVELTREAQAGDGGRVSDMVPQRNPSGFAATFSTTGSIDLNNPFFKSLGTNGRTCATCHQQGEGWTVTPEGIRARFFASHGKDPIFRTNDGSNSPNADVSTVAARFAAYSMLLNKGLIRVGIGIPANAEFELLKADDPYGFASAKELSLFRRPLPSTNLKFLSTVMWDGRETFKDANSTDCILGTTTCFASIHFDLADQSNGATLGHAQAAEPLTQKQREAIVSFETSLFTAQIFDDDARRLTAHGAKGGPKHASNQPFYFGNNDVVSGDYRTHAPFNPNVFTLYSGWHRAHVGREADDDERVERGVVQARQAVARGEALFNTKPITITGVKGINDDLRVPVLQGSCTTCHDSPGAGNHSIPAPLDIGLTDATRRTADMPLYTLRNLQTGEVIQTTDPGRALLTGRWRDIGRFKGPILRAVAARAPYFHNGFAKDLDAVVEFYNERFGIGFTSDEKADLVAFLKAL
jgi:cytochrome c peroxidase